MRRKKFGNDAPLKCKKSARHPIDDAIRIIKKPKYDHFKPNRYLIISKFNVAEADQSNAAIICREVYVNGTPKRIKNPIGQFVAGPNVVVSKSTHGVNPLET
jgi:hypothetical protein